MATNRSISSVLAELDGSKDGSSKIAAWLDETFAAPAAFERALLEHARVSWGAPLRSRPGVCIDLYHDAVTRHAAVGRVAFRHDDPRRGPRELSYVELDARATSLAATWAALGVAEGDPLALLLPLGEDLVVALAAALRLGAPVTFIEKNHSRHVEARLALAKPKRVVFDPRTPPPAKNLEKLALSPFPQGRSTVAAPHAYLPNEPAFAVLSPTRPLGKPILVPAEGALVRALADAIFVLRLAPGRSFSAPGLSEEQSFPALLLATLVAGATFVHFDLDDLAKDPSKLSEARISVLVATAALVALAKDKPVGKPGGLAAVLRPVDEPLDWVAQNDFMERNGLASVPSGNFMMDAAAPGGLLFSASRVGQPSAFVLPCPGLPFSLMDVMSGEATTGSHGVFLPKKWKKPKEDGYFILAKQSAEYLYGGTLTPRRAARLYPEDEVTALLAELPFVAGACVAAVPGGPGAKWAFHLIVFLGARPGQVVAPDGTELEKIRMAIGEGLGEDALPDMIALFPLWPRKKGAKVDAEACRAQYLSGRLARKAREPSLQRLAELRGALLGQ